MLAVVPREFADAPVRRSGDVARRWVTELSADQRVGLAVRALMVMRAELCPLGV